MTSRLRQFLHQSDNVSSIFTNVKNKSMDLCGNRLLQSDCVNVFYEIGFA